MKSIPYPLLPKTIVGTLCAILGATLLFASTSASAYHFGKKNSTEVCYQTTIKMRASCYADAWDNYYEASAKCLNSEDPEDCLDEAKEEGAETAEECSVAAEGRNDLCDRLPDAGPYIVEIDPDDFNGVNGSCYMPDGQNPYFPLVVGTVATFQSEEEEETIIVTVTDETRLIEGVETTVVRDTVYDGLEVDDEGNPEGDRIEDTDDYYAIDLDCNVWYFGEVSQSFEDGYLESLDGSFIAGVEGAQPGIVMLANPMVGDVYRQEFALGEAEDAAEVLELGVSLELEVSEFSCEADCLKTEDFIANEPDEIEYKYYKPGIGFVAEEVPGEGVLLELISVEGP